MRKIANKSMFCILVAVAFVCMGALSTYAIDTNEGTEFIQWFNGIGDMNRITKSLAMGLFRIDTKFYDRLTREQVEEFRVAKDKFMRNAIRTTKDKYARYVDKKQAKEEARMIKYKGIGVYIGVPRNIHDKREERFKEQVIGAVQGLGLTDEDFKSKDASTIELIDNIVARLKEKNPEFKKFQENFKKGFLDASGTEILRVIVNGPLYKAGLKSKERIEDVRDGWRITHIDGKSSDGFFINDFTDLISKNKKKSVILTLSSPSAESEKETIEVEIEKSIVKGAWLTNDIINAESGQIGVITFNHFDFSRQENKLNAKMFDDALIANEKSIGIIIDLRDNGGGMLVEADIVLERLLPNGRTEVILDYRGKKREPVSTSAQIKRLWNGGPIVFITNGHSASASELVSGSMREQLPNLVKIVGAPTFGKGSIQNHYTDFPDGTQMNITVGRFKMPISEKTFEGEPLQPDVLVEDDKKTPEDEQLNKAIEVLEKLVISNNKRKEALKALVFE